MGAGIGVEPPEQQQQKAIYSQLQRCVPLLRTHRVTPFDLQ